MWEFTKFERLAPGVFRVTLRLRTWKGETGVAATEREYVLESVTNAHNVLFDAAMWFVLFAWLRGIFGDLSFDELINGESFEIVKLSKFDDKPVFCAFADNDLVVTKPALSKQAYETTKLLAVNAGLPATGVLTALRHGGANAWALQTMSEISATVLGHTDNSRNRTLHKHYLRGTGDLPLVAIRLGAYNHEMSDLNRTRLHMRDIDSDAVVALAGFTALERERKRLAELLSPDDDDSANARVTTHTTNRRTQYGTRSVDVDLTQEHRQEIQVSRKSLVPPSSSSSAADVRHRIGCGRTTTRWTPLTPAC
ncbi:hypothetical protein PENSPDRAFT_439580 [Peniophora sp. CONT]|nr:hypothetical protein PENSPDRAFT_439580 [Peniophora sp. CONT]